MSSVCSSNQRILRDIKPSKAFFSDDFVHDKKIYDVMSSSVTRLVSSENNDIEIDLTNETETVSNKENLANVVKIYQYKVNKNQMQQYQLTDSDLQDLKIVPESDTESVNNSVLSMEKSISKDDFYDWKNHYMLMSADWDRILYSYKHIIFSFLSLNLEKHKQVDQFIQLVDLAKLHYDVHQKYIYNQQDIDSTIDCTSKMLQIDVEISNLLLKQFNPLYESLNKDKN